MRKPSFDNPSTGLRARLRTSLWEPSQERRNQANITRFIGFVNGKYRLEGEGINLQGSVGALVQQAGVTIKVRELSAPPGTRFRVSQRSQLEAINALSRQFTVTEQGKESGILTLSMTGSNPDQIANILNHIAESYLRQNIARQASIGAGLGVETGATTINKVCGSGMRAVIMAAQGIQCGDLGLAVAGGCESMSNAPYFLRNARTGYRMGNGELIDAMIHDGLWDVYTNQHMGNCGELCAKEHKFSREAQDEYARESFRRALAAQKEGLFKNEITPVSVPQKKGEPALVSEDEGPPAGRPDKFATLKPAFQKDGTITAANASSINDGASAVILASEKAVKQHRLEPLARIVVKTA